MLILRIYFNKEAFCYGKCYTFWHRNTSLVLIERNPDTLLPGRGVRCPNGAGIPRLAGQCPLLPAQSQPGSSARWWPQRCSDPRGSCALRAPLLPTHHGGRTHRPQHPAELSMLQWRPLQRKGWGKDQQLPPSPQPSYSSMCSISSFWTAYLSSSLLFQSWIEHRFHHYFLLKIRNTQITYPLINSIFLCLISQFLLLAQPIIPPFSTQLLPFSFKAASHFLHSITMQ